MPTDYCIVHGYYVGGGGCPHCLRQFQAAGKKREEDIKDETIRQLRKHNETLVRALDEANEERLRLQCHVQVHRNRASYVAGLLRQPSLPDPIALAATLERDPTPALNNWKKEAEDQKAIAGKFEQENKELLKHCHELHEQLAKANEKLDVIAIAVSDQGVIERVGA